MATRYPQVGNLCHLQLTSSLRYAAGGSPPLVNIYLHGEYISCVRPLSAIVTIPFKCAKCQKWESCDYCTFRVGAKILLLLSFVLCNVKSFSVSLIRAIFLLTTFHIQPDFESPDPISISSDSLLLLSFSKHGWFKVALIVYVQYTYLFTCLEGRVNGRRNAIF